MGEAAQARGVHQLSRGRGAALPGWDGSVRRGAPLGTLAGGARFSVKLMTPIAVKAYRAGVHKNDQRDARAVAEATGRSQGAAVRVKSEAAQATQALMRGRERRIRQGVQTANQLRGPLNEFGIVLPKGPQLLLARACELMATAPFAALPAAVQELVQTPVDEVVEQAQKGKAVDAALMTAAATHAHPRPPLG